MAVELYKHNKYAYEKILENFKKTNKTCVIHPTGSGKSFISLKFIDDNIDKNILLLAPTYPILQQFKLNIYKNILNMDTSTLTSEELDQIISEKFPNIKFMIYSNIKKEESENKYDCIILDEFHRCGAEEWGKGISQLLESNSSAKVLGLSATAIRYLDDNRNMADEIFDGNISSEISLAKAIALGILPIPAYVSAIYSFEDDLNRIEERINKVKDKDKKMELEKKLSQAKKMIENAEGISDIFEKNITKKNGKYIVFCRNKEHMKKMEEESKKWFSTINNNIEISEVYYENGIEKNKYIIDKFAYSKSPAIKLLFSIDMLNEGLHVDNIDGVIMLRPTTSPIIYFQQMGRALSVGHNENPQIFDIVNNYRCTDLIKDLKKEIEEELDKILKEGNALSENGVSRKEIEKVYDSLSKFSISDDLINIEDLLSKIEEETLLKSTLSWEEMYEYAKIYFEHKGNLDVKASFKTNNGWEEDLKGKIALGNWIQHQRQLVSPESERGKKLAELGMRFENKNTRLSFEEVYEYAKRYYEHNGDLNVPSIFKTNNGWEEDPKGKINLGACLYHLRRTISPESEKGKKLLEIGMIFSNKYSSLSWEEVYEYAKRYYEHIGNLDVRNDFKTSNGWEEDSKGKINLGRWISYQRQKESPETEKGKKLLEIGMNFEKKIILPWKEMYEYAKRYYEHKGDLEVRQDFKTSNGWEEDSKGKINLGTWISYQRMKVSPESEKGKKLLEIGMRFKNINSSLSWEEMYEYAKRYYEHQGDLNVKPAFKTNNGYEYDENGKINLGTWIQYQRKSIVPESKKGQLLIKIGFKWFDNSRDDILQKELITSKNQEKKEKEIKTRTYSLLGSYDDNYTPSKEEINQDFIDELNHKRR